MNRNREIAIAVLVALMSCAAVAQVIEPTPTEEPHGATETTVFAHPDTWWWVSGQFNTILQGHPSFPAEYSGPHSLEAKTERGKDSRVLTLFTGLRVFHWTEVLVDVESAGGHGISDALGLAGFTNLDVVRNPDLGPTPYLARAMLYQVIPLSRETDDAEAGPLSIFHELPKRRLEFRAGKFSIVDFFDLNTVLSDSHLGFMNWTVDNNGAYDYAADTRGYTYGALLDYERPGFGVTFAEALMPEVANGLNLSWDLQQSRAENVEVELKSPLLPGRDTHLRLLSYINHANMGDYRQAIDLVLSGVTPTPIIEDTRRPGTIKYGFGVNFEEEIVPSVRIGARGGWNEGQHESFVYTEVNNTFCTGTQILGKLWGRKLDQAGAAFVTNGISNAHRTYLALGGLGFLLGDGGLTYGRETIFEGYYTAHVWRGVFVAANLQHINNPGYNQVRGPVWVPGLRLHIEF
jgi:high affinity Mn2+ porin